MEEEIKLLLVTGVETVANLASCSPGDVENILYSAEPFKSKRDGENLRLEQKKIFEHVFCLEGK